MSAYLFFGHGSIISAAKYNFTRQSPRGINIIFADSAESFHLYNFDKIVTGVY